MRNAFTLSTSAALLAAGALASRLLFGAYPTASADGSAPGPRASFMQVVNSQKTNEPLVFVYDEESKRLLMYTTIAGKELELAAARNTVYDARIQEYKNSNEKGMSVKELKKAFEEEDAKEREAAQKKADEEAKKEKAKEKEKAKSAS